jgi:hypothetical protein
VNQQEEQIAESILGPKIRQVVEDHWRAVLTAAWSGDTGKADKLTDELERNVTYWCESFPQHANLAKAILKRERDKLELEYYRNPDMFRLRLGLPSPQQPAPTVVVQERSNLGDLVVRTAVRATVWETVRSIFRAFR